MIKIDKALQMMVERMTDSSTSLMIQSDSRHAPKKFQEDQQTRIIQLDVKSGRNSWPSLERT